MANVLLIDDEATFRQPVKVYLTAAGHEVTEAGDGKSALAVLRQVEIDLIITDLIMPDLDGIELISAMRREIPEIPIIATSGGGYVSAPDMLKAARLLGVDRTFAKPFELEDLGKAVAELTG